MSTEQRTLHLPPGYVAEERAYGTVVMMTARRSLALVGTRACNSYEEIEEAAWEEYSDSIRDYIMERRVAVEASPVAGERAVGEDS